MAKKSAIELNNKRKRMVKKFAVKRAAAKSNRNRSVIDDGRALRSTAQTRRAATQFGAQQSTQSLRNLRAPARLLPQIEDVTHRLARVVQPGLDPRYGQVELVIGLGDKRRTLKWQSQIR